MSECKMNQNRLFYEKQVGSNKLELLFNGSSLDRFLLHFQSLGFSPGHLESEDFHEMSFLFTSTSIYVSRLPLSFTVSSFSPHLRFLELRIKIQILIANLF